MWFSTWRSVTPPCQAGELGEPGLERLVEIEAALVDEPGDGDRSDRLDRAVDAEHVVRRHGTGDPRVADRDVEDALAAELDRHLGPGGEETFVDLVLDALTGVVERDARGHRVELASCSIAAANAGSASSSPSTASGSMCGPVASSAS